jgi:hypothetical protein
VVRFGEGTAFDEHLQLQLRLALGGRAQVTPTGLVMRASPRGFAHQASALGEILTLVGRISAKAGETPARN